MDGDMPYYRGGGGRGGGGGGRGGPPGGGGYPPYQQQPPQHYHHHHHSQYPPGPPPPQQPYGGYPPPPHPHHQQQQQQPPYPPQPYGGGPMPYGGGRGGGGGDYRQPMPYGGAAPPYDGDDYGRGRGRGYYRGGGGGYSSGPYRGGGGGGGGGYYDQGYGYAPRRDYHQGAYGGYGGDYGRGRGRGGGGYYRGGRGGGGGGGDRRRQLFCVVHLDSFTMLEEAGRRGGLESVVSPHLLQRFAGQAARIAVIVERRYMAALVSVPPNPAEDIFLSPATCREFFCIANVVSDDGLGVADRPTGAAVPRSLFQPLVACFRCLTAFDKPAAEVPGLDVLTVAPHTLVRDLVTNKNVYALVRDALLAETDAAVGFFRGLLECVDADGDADAPAQQQQQPHQQGDEGRGGDERSRAVSNWLRNRCALLRTPQGVRLVEVAMERPRLREAFFDLAAHSSEVFCALFDSPLAGHLLLHALGLTADKTAPPPAKVDAEVDLVCGALARFGIRALCGANGPSLLRAAMEGLLPRYVRQDALTFSRRGPGGRGKRGREDDDEAGGARRRTEGGDGSSSAATGEATDAPGAAAPAGERRTPVTLADYRPQEEPSDWRFIRAVVAALAAGDVVELEEEAETTPIARRVRLVTEHFLGCRAMQQMVPHMADALLRPAAPGDSEEQTAFCKRCGDLLTEICGRSKRMMIHMHGNYVVQTLILELAPRAVPGTVVESLLQIVLSKMVERIFDISVQKFASNCVDRALAATAQLPDPAKFALDVAKALLAKGDEMLLTLATNQYGNYVVRHVLERLGTLASGATELPADQRESVCATEEAFRQKLSAHMAQLRASGFSFAIVNWLEEGAQRGEPRQQQQQQQ